MGAGRRLRDRSLKSVSVLAERRGREKEEGRRESPGGEEEVGLYV